MLLCNSIPSPPTTAVACASKSLLGKDNDAEVKPDSNNS